MITSDQISAMTGNFQAQTMGQMQHAAMISQQIGGHQNFGQAAMGRAVNVGASIGAPVAMGGMALAGLDPISMGMRGAAAGFQGFGAAGAIGGGMLGAGAVGLPLMAAQYAGTQMMTGMQQQQQLNAMLSQQYQFMGGTGRGFNPGQTGQIGEFLRSMAGQAGPGGEMATMGELSRMAQAMGQMGMGRGINDVRDFTEKFRKMMSEVKEVATAFHTSLEEAQQIMGSMRASGIFSNQGQVAQQIRNYSIAGGLATSEVTSMMNIGSQISRSIGGRGSAGAMGGMKAIGQVGAALQAGVLNEEDIYNATGLTGAEGRQAFASSMMQRSARFLRGGLGRRFLASVAGRDGTLDEASVMDYMYGGGMGTGETMGSAYSNLGKVGRANFIRNEGRLRGAALEQFGGNIDVMAMKGWLEQRGMDTGSDRARIFMSRRLGIGMEELDEQLKLLNNMPQIMQEQEMAGFRDQRLSRIERMRSNTGISGIKKKFERARNEINNKLQQAGADFYQAGSNLIERWANELTDQFMVEMSENLEPAIQEVLRGGSGAAGVLSSRFGIGGRGLIDKGLRQSLGDGSFGARGGLSPLAAAERAGDLKRLRGAGYGFMGDTDAGLREHMTRIQGLQAAMQETDIASESLGKANSDFLLRQYGLHGMGKGFEAQTSFADMIARSSDPKMRELAKRYNLAGEKERARIMSSTMRGAGLGSSIQAVAGAPELQAIFGQGGFRTARDRDQAIGDYMFKHAGGSGEYITENYAFGLTRGELAGAVAGGYARAGAATATAWGVGLTEVLGIGDDIQRAVGGWAENQFNEAVGGMEKEVRAAGGTYMMTDDAQRLLRGALSRDTREAADANRAISQRMKTLMDNKDNLSVAEKGEHEALRSMSMATQFRNLAEHFGPKQAAAMMAASPEWDGFTEKDISARARGAIGTLFRDQGNARRELVERAQGYGAGRAGRMRGAGLMKGGRLTAASIEEFGKIGSMEQVSVAAGEGINTSLAMRTGISRDEIRKGGTVAMSSGQRWLAAQAASADALERLNTMDPNDPRNAELLQFHVGMQRDAAGQIAGMSNAELSKMRESLMSHGMVGSARDIAAQQGFRRRLGRAGGGARGMTIFAETLGTNMSRQELMKLGSGGDIDALTRALGTDLVGGKFDEKGDLGKALKSALEAQKAGRTEEAAAGLAEIQKSHGTEIAKHRRSMQDEKAKEDDPGYRMLSKINSTMEGLPEKLAGAMSKQTLNVTGEVRTIEGSNPENRGREGGS